ncbi:ArnT family glycosyltransferase [Denitromonas sp.]|uniref:ArnT family glycosyltransferase n=1 Tax=Denitromonas sp. TaxID=2734609 RepID=UPI002AFED1F7|nr:glycosyltransferase family 39 protein [Denitromonas sp.]
MALPPGAGDQREWMWLFVVLCIGLGMRAAAIALYHHTPESDEIAYASMAMNLINGHGIVDYKGNQAMYSVGYPLFVLAPVFSLFGENPFAARIANLLLGGLSILLCHRVAAEAGANRSGRLIAATIWALYLPASVYGVYLLKENLMVPLMLGVIWCALRLSKRPSAAAAIGCGVLLGAIALTGSAALSLGAAVAYALWVCPASTYRRGILALCIAAGVGAVSAPWIVRNMNVLGAPVLNTNGGFNLYLGNNPAATGMFVSIVDTPRGKGWEAFRQAQGEVEASESLKRDAIAWIVDDPVRFAALMVKKAAYFWTPPFHEGKGESSRIESIVRALWAVQFTLLVVAALGSFLSRHVNARQLATLWLAIAGYTAVHMLFYVIFRYREPIMPILGIIAALSLQPLLGRIGLLTAANRTHALSEHPD